MRELANSAQAPASRKGAIGLTAMDFEFHVSNVEILEPGDHFPGRVVLHGTLASGSISVGDVITVPRVDGTRHRTVVLSIARKEPRFGTVDFATAPATLDILINQLIRDLATGTVLPG